MRDIYVATSEEEREIVRTVQRTLQIPQTGEMDTDTRMRIRGMQMLFRLPATGILDEKTMGRINEMRNRHG